MLYRVLVVVCVLFACMRPSTAQTTPDARYAEASTAFMSFGLETRLYIQMLLSATGHWVAVPNSTFNHRIYDAITAFQVDMGQPPTGILTLGQARRLTDLARPVLARWRLAAAAIPGTNVSVWIPAGLDLTTRNTQTGLKFENELQTFTLYLNYYPGESIDLHKKAIEALLRRYNIQIEYTAVKPNFVVVSGLKGSMGMYMRYHKVRRGTVGFTMVYDKTDPTVMGDRLRILMSASLWSWTTPSAPRLSIPTVRDTTEPADTADTASAPAIIPKVPTSALPQDTPKPDPSPSSGTGFYVSAQGLVVTNAHVVENCSTIRVERKTGSTVGTLKARDKDNDLALIATGDAPEKTATLRLGPKLGEPVAAFGYPLSGILSSSGNFTLGNVTALSGLGDNTRYLQISTPVQPGNSGGPLVDNAGNVVGVVSAKLNALTVMAATGGDIPQNVNFAIKASILTSFLESNGATFSTTAATAPLPPTDLADAAVAISVRVTCTP